MHVIIDRWECKFLSKIEKQWILVYGRRKTGKTWLLRRCSKWSVYVTVTRDGACIVDDRGQGIRVVGLRECIDHAISMLKKPGHLVVVDEFQRLPEKYWEIIASVGWEAESGLQLCGSSLSIVGKVFGHGSPILGLLTPFKVDIASLEDTIASLANALSSAWEAVAWSIIARDPWILRHINLQGEPWGVLASEAVRLLPAARGLLGEIFEEEGRSLTRTYDAVLRLLAKGYWRASDIALRLYEAGLTEDPSPSSATGILGVLEKIGLVEKVPLWRTRGSRRYYRHRSSLLALLYSLSDEVDELGVEPSPETVKSRYGVELAFNIGEMMARAKGLARGYSVQGARDVDIVLLDKKGRALWGYEVKMGSINAREAREVADWIHSLGIAHAGVITLKESPKEPLAIDEIMDAEAIVELAKKLAEERRASPRENII